MTPRCSAEELCLLPDGHDPLVIGDPDDRDAPRAPHLLVNAKLAGLLVPIDELAPFPGNPRQGDVGALSVSLLRFGVVAPARVQRSSGYIVAGNHTWKAGRALGAAYWPSVDLDVDDREARAFLVADNRLHDLGTYDERALAAILADLASNDGLTGVGFDGEDVDELLRRLADPLPPETFPDVSDVAIEYQCPKCGHGWSGSPK